MAPDLASRTEGRPNARKHDDPDQHQDRRHDGLMDGIADFAGRSRPEDFPVSGSGLAGRGRPTLEFRCRSLTALAAVDLQDRTRDQRSATAAAQSGRARPSGAVAPGDVDNRLILGVGSGSTRDDFELLGYDYDHRFRTFKNDLEIMDRVWNGEAVNGGTLATWPGCKGGPPILIGAWRSPRWITYAAEGRPGMDPVRPLQQPRRFEHGMKIYREAGGANAVLANCSVDLKERPESAELATLARVNFICPPEEAAGASSASSKWASRKS